MMTVGAEVQARVAEPHHGARDQHPDGLVEIVGGDHAALFLRVAALLDVGVERHHEEAAGHRQEDHRDGGQREASGARPPARARRRP